MKRLSLVLLVVVVASSLLVFAGCTGNKLDKAIKNANDYTIVCGYDVQTNVLSAVQKVCVTNNSGNNFDSVKFHTYANCYKKDAVTGVVCNGVQSKAYPHGASYGQIDFDCVKVDGNAVAYVIEGENMDVLSVPVSDGFAPGDKVEIELTYEITLANICHRLGYNDNTVNFGNFFPILCHVQNDNYCTTPYYCVGDPFVSDVANYLVTLTLPDNYLVATSGQLCEATHDGNYTTYTYSAKGVRDFAMVASDKYNKLSATVGKTQVDYYYYDDQDAEGSLATAVGTLQYLSKNVGQYPYPNYSVCQTEFCYGGMEYPCLSMVTHGTQTYHEAIAHETAHQWFYAIVGNDQIEHPWMDEGLVEYLTYLYLDSAGQQSLSSFVKQNIKTYTTYVDVLNRYYENVDTTIRPIYDYDNDSQYTIFTYLKGSLMFDTVYNTMGKAKFFKALQKYFDQCCYTVATPSQLIDAFANVGGKEIAGVFENYLQGKDIIGQITD